MEDATCVYELFHIFYADSRDRSVEAVIVHKTKGFSRAIRDKIIVQENNRIAKRALLIFTLSNACSFFLRVSCVSHVFLSRSRLANCLYWLHTHSRLTLSR